MAKILIVEDKAEDFERIAEFLKNKGFQVVSAKNGYEGLYQFDKESSGHIHVPAFVFS